MREHQELTVEWRPIDAVRPYERNPRLIPQTAIEKVAASIRSFGWRQPIVVDAAGVIVAGHTRHLAAKHLGLERVPVHVADLTDQEARAYRLADNRVGEETSWEPAALDFELTALGQTGFDLAPLGFGPLQPIGDIGTSLNSEAPRASVPLTERFGVVPFSVLNAREGWWQNRKRAWLDLGIQSELGRGENTLRFSDTVLQATR